MQEGFRQGMLLVIALDQPRGEHLFLRLPGIVGHRIALPFDQVLQFMPFPEEAMPRHSLYFKLLFSVHHFRWRAIIIRSMFGYFVIGGQQEGMKYIMDGPGQWELELVSNR